MSDYLIGDKIGKYEIVSVLGEGGVGIVYKVRNVLLDSDFALKTCKIHHESIHERLKLEGRVQTKLKHPNIVSVIDMLMEQDSPCLVMEYVDGVSLDIWLSQHPSDFKQMEYLFLQIIDAIHYAHSQNVIHRDLKTSNILITDVNGRPFAKICDFGLAKIPNHPTLNLTQSGAVMGTPSYMAPEQIRNSKDVDLRADIFSLGAIFYEMLTGQLAFSGSDTLSLLNSVANDPHPSPRSYIKDLPERYCTAIDGALEKDRHLRIPDSQTLRNVLLGEMSWDSQPSYSLSGVEELDATIPVSRTQKSASVEHMHDDETHLIQKTPPKTQTLPPKSISQPPENRSSNATTSQNSGQTSSARRIAIPLTALVAILFVVFVYDIPSRIVPLQESDTSNRKEERPAPTQERNHINPPKFQTAPKIQTKTQKTKTAKSTKTKTKAKKKKQPKRSIEKKTTEKQNETKTQKTKTKTTAIAATAYVSFEGADHLFLKGDNGQFSTGDVPVGYYTVYAVFDSRQIKVSAIQLQKGQVKHFKCNDFRTTCE
ncbi:MAG: serine/threonine-protein kinase [Myxococcota bacterium]|nr:serine/threonine-protein kinase [Myxococcota bacterium]